MTEPRCNSARVRTRTVGIAAALLVVLGPAIARAQPTGGGIGDSDDSVAEDASLYNCGKAHGKIVVNFKPEVGLKDLITWAMGFTCKNFIYSASIGGRNQEVTIIAPKRMLPAQAWRLFLVSLQSMNLTVVPKGNVLEIVEAPKAKYSPLPVHTGGVPATDQIVRVIMRPQYISVDDLSDVLKELKSKDGEVKAVGSANIVVVTDYGSQINRMRQIVRQVDRPGGGETLYMLRVEYADAVEMAKKLEEILSGEGGSNSSASRKGKAAASDSGGSVAAAVPSKIIADERTNSLILLASEPAYLRVKALVDRLDISVDAGTSGRIRVYYLQYADAEELANTLTAVISGVRQSQPQAQNGRPRRNQRRQPAAPAAAGVPAFEGEVNITFDKPTNSLVIIASVRDYRALVDVIRNLDVPRPQVYIEASIIEVSVNNSRDLGVSFHGGVPGPDGSLLVGGVQHSKLSTLGIGVNPEALLGVTGLIGGAIGPLIPEAEELLGVSLPSFGVLVQALASSSNVNLLSTPHIITADNEEAEISVGENIPTLAGGSAGFGGAAGQQGLFPVQNISRQNVALTLKIEPHINASQMVRMDIDLEISSIASKDFEGLGPSWAQRSIKNTVVVGDEQTVVLGGLMRDRVTTTESKVPLLGDIPILGYLFKYESKTKEKTNLLVLLTPHIVTDQMDLEKILERRLREQREFTRTFSSFQSIDYRPDIDYGHKRGLVEEINRAILREQKERELLEQIDSGGTQLEDGPIEYRQGQGRSSGVTLTPVAPALGDEDTPLRIGARNMDMNVKVEAE